jgi:hypothetical protein
MNAYILSAVATFALSPDRVVAKECDLASISSTGSANEALSRRAIAIVREAARNGWRGNAQLEASLTTNATFSLGAGDVLRPLGTGVAGAHAFALAVNATRYRFYGYDYMDIPGRGGAQTSRFRLSSQTKSFTPLQ